MKQKIIGVTGAIGSGKSTLSLLLEKHNGYIIDADKISKEALEVGRTPYHQVVELFGEQILNTDATINRSVLRKIIIDHPIMKEKLEGIVHPYVTNTIISVLNKPNSCKFFVIDAPLLFEANIDKICDYVIFVDVDPQIRYVRLKHRNTMALNDAKALEQGILSNEMKKNKSHFIVDNSRDIAYLHDQLFAILLQIAL